MGIIYKPMKKEDGIVYNFMKTFYVGYIVINRRGRNKLVDVTIKELIDAEIEERK